MNPCASRTVLVVEDEMMVAALIEELLLSLGWGVVGPASKLETAIRLATEERFDVAILDVTIRGGQVFPVAEILLQRRIPFVLATGYGAWALPEAFRDSPRLQKPFRPAELEAALNAICP